VKKLLLAINAFNRPYTLKLLLTYLEYVGFSYPFIVLDHGSTDSEQIALLKSLQSNKKPGNCLDIIKFDVNQYKGNFACGFARKNCIDFLLDKYSNYDYFFVIDCDILINNKTIEICLEDFQKLRDCNYKVATYSPYSFVDGNNFVIDNVIYSNAVIGGDASVFYDRKALIDIGNNFGAFPGGFGDYQWYCGRRKGYLHITRLSPVSEIQHLGILDGCVCERPYRPFWLNDLLRDCKTGQYVSIKDFNPFEFYLLAKRFGCKVACDKFLEKFEQEFLSTTVERDCLT